MKNEVAIRTAAFLAWPLLLAACTASAAAEVDMNALRQHINQGNAYLTARHFTQALAEYDKALVVDPGNLIAKSNIAATHNSWGIAYFSQHKYKEAMREWELCLKLSPNNSNAKRNIAILQRALAQQGIDLDHEEQASSPTYNEEVIGVDNGKSAGGPHQAGSKSGVAPSNGVQSYPGDAAGSPSMTDEPHEQPPPKEESDKRLEEAREAPASESGEHGAVLILNLPDKHPRSLEVTSPPVSSPSPAVAIPSGTAPLPSEAQPITPVVPSADAHVRSAPGPTFSLHASEGAAAQQSPAVDDTSLKTAVDGARPSQVSEAPSGSLQDMLAALETKLDGKTHDDLSVMQRIVRMEKIVGGKSHEGTMIERVDALRKDIGR